MSGSSPPQSPAASLASRMGPIPGDSLKKQPPVAKVAARPPSRSWADDDDEFDEEERALILQTAGIGLTSATATTTATPATTTATTTAAAAATTPTKTTAAPASPPPTAAEPATAGSKDAGKEGTLLLETHYEVAVKLADMQGDPDSPLFSVKRFEDLGLYVCPTSPSSSCASSN